MKFCFLLLFSLLTILTRAQDQDYRHAISINLLNYEKIQQAHIQYEPVYAWRSFSSIKYQLSIFRNFYWQVNAAYAKQYIEEECTKCINTPTGTGKLKEFQFASGLGNKFEMFNQSVIMPFIEVNLYYVRSHYMAQIHDWWFLGPVLNIDRKTNYFGINPNVGLELRPLKHFGLRFFSGGSLFYESTKKGTASSNSISSDAAVGAEFVVHF